MGGPVEPGGPGALSRRLTPYLLLLPAILLIAGLVAALGTLFVESLTADGRLGPEQYGRVLGNPDYRAPFWLSARLAAIATVIALVLAFPVAWHMERTSPAARRAIFAFLVLVFFSDYVLRMFGLVLVFGNNGIINRALLALGLVERPARLMFNQPGVVIGLVAGSLPFAILAIHGVLARLDRRLLDAAALLGAPPWRRFLAVTLPLSVPGLIAGGTLTFLLSLNSFITPALLGGGFVEMVANFVYEQAINLFNLPLGAAAAMLLLAAALGLILLTNAAVDRFGRRFGIRPARRPAPHP